VLNPFSKFILLSSKCACLGSHPISQKPSVNLLTLINTAQVEKKQAEYEFLMKKRLEAQQTMELVDRELNLYNDNNNTTSWQLSEPATPPEFRDNGFPSALSRPNRFSASNLILSSPPGTSSRSSRAGSQVNSPPTERARAYQALTSPVSRRHSDEEEDDYEDEVLDFNHRSAAS